MSSLVAIARGEGPAAAVGALHTAAPGLACTTAGWTIAAERDVDDAAAVLCDRLLYAREDGSFTRVDSAALGRFGLVAARFVPGEGARGRQAHAVARGWGQLRLGLALALNDSALAHLADRVAGGVPVLQHQLVKGLVADAAIELVHARAVLDAPAPSAGASRAAHRRITQAGRTLLQLLGASGFLLTGPGAVAHVSELIENVVVQESNR